MMCKKLVFVWAVVGFALAPVAPAANIVWVSDNKTPAAGVPADQAWVDMLTAAGHTVDLSFRNQEGRVLTAAEVAALNAAQLIIVSRDTDSGQYASDAAEVTQWNNITAPMIVQIAHFIRNNRWKWVNTATTADVQPAMEAVLPGHPILKGVPLGANNQVSILTTNCSIVAISDVGTGTLIARRADNGEAWIAEWEQGVEFYAGSGERAGGKRLFFAGGGTAGVSDGTYNYTDDGKKMLLNAINYMLGISGDPIASGPSPVDAATDVPHDVTLSWKPGIPGQSHDVYLGTSLDDVNNASVANALGLLVSQGQDANTYEPADLEYGRNYYWRIDEVNAPPDSTVFKGGVWSFTVEPYAYPIENVAVTASSFQAGMGPENTVNRSGLNANDEHSTEGTQMWLSEGTQPNWIQFEFDRVYKLHELWVWNSNQLIEAFIGFGAKDVTIEHSTDGENWTALEGVPEFARAPGMPTYTHDTVVPFGGAVAKYVRLTINSGWGSLPQAGLSEVRFFHVPVQARQPEPADDAEGIDLDVILNWRPGREAASHTVYFGADETAVTSGTAAAETVADHSFSPAGLEFGTTYYWRVDEVNGGAYEGEVWSFTTQEYAVVEDFESYNDDDNRIYETWIDGLTTQAYGGSQVGYDVSPFAEKTIVHGGGQSMPLLYDNTAAPQYSEAVLTFDAPQNWTADGIQSLSLYFQGAPDNGGQLYLKINNTKVPYNGDAADITKPVWLPWNIDLSTVSGNLSSVTRLTIGIEPDASATGGPSGPGGATGIVYLDDIRLYPKTPEFVTPTEPDGASLLALYTFEGNANDTSGHGLNGILRQAVLVSSGRTGGGSALELSKVGYVDLGNPPSLDFSTGDWTVTAWFKTAMTGTGDANQGTLYGKGGDNTGGHRYCLIMSQIAEGVVTLVVDDDVTRYDANSQTRTNDDEWHCVAGQREGTALRISIDGQLEGTTTIPADYNLSGTSQHNAYIGAMTYHPDGTLYKLYNGLIDDVRVYDKALSEAEILWLAGKTTPVAKPL